MSDHHHNQATQVANAASLVVAPQTDAATRQAASAFLESWTHSPQAWDLYGPWLASFIVVTASDTTRNRSVELLCLQLCQAKIRRELPRKGHAAAAPPRATASTASLEAIRHALMQLILQSQQHAQDATLLQSACICLTSLQVRITPLANFLPSLMMSCHAHPAPSPTTNDVNTLRPWAALKLLAEIPTELESCIDMPSASAITAELIPHWPAIQSIVLQHLESSLTTTSLAAVQVLKSWVKSCHVTLSQLSNPPTLAMLPRLVQCLSQTSYHADQAELVTAVAQCLTTAVRQPADSCTPERQAAIVALVDATRVDGFIGGPLLYAAQQQVAWDTCVPHALVTFLTTLVTEDVDEIIALPADGLLHLLLEIQRTHPVLSIRSLVLEAWLTVQDVPVQERHLHWRAPLQTRIVDTLCHALQYPANFVSWDEEIHVDQDEWEEYRRLAPDVLIGCYCMLRADFVQRLTSPLLRHDVSSSSLSSSSWVQHEAALFALTATARQVCGRIKTNVGGSQIVQDKVKTVNLLQQVAARLISQYSSSSSLPPPPLMDTQCQFWGAYAGLWAHVESSDLVTRILEQLRVMLEHAGNDVRASAALALKSVLTVSAVRLLDTAVNSLQVSLQGLFSIALQSQDENIILPVAEGCVRLLVQLSDATLRDQALVSLAQILTQHGRKALSMIPTDGSSLSEQGAAAMNALEQSLHVVAVMIRFAQSADEEGPPLLSTALNQFLWPFLEAASQRMHHYETVLDGVLFVQQQLLRSMPEWYAAQFTSTLESWVRVFERTKKPSMLAYFSSAVEAYGARETNAFESLLNHISQVLFVYLSSEKPVYECTELVEALFEMCQRFFVFAPASIARCEALPSLATCAVECLTACRGERNATRATLNFLEKLTSWRRLPVPADFRRTLELSSHRLDETIATHGQRLIQACISLLTSGPRMLWPPAGDVIFSVVLTTIAWPVPGSSNSCLAQQWLESVSLGTNNNGGTYVKNEQALKMYPGVVGQLLTLAQKGPTMKAKAKFLLSDFSLVVNGQKSPETLIA